MSSSCISGRWQKPLVADRIKQPLVAEQNLSNKKAPGFPGAFPVPKN
jgi:hypothetical protein